MAKCECESSYQTVKHILMECQLYYRLRRETWEEERKKPEGRAILNTFSDILTDTHFARKAAIFMKDTGLIGQFEGLKSFLDI